MSAPSRRSGLSRDYIAKACEAKNRYADMFAAIANGERLAVTAGHPLYCYRCGVCAWWHLTKNPLGYKGNPVTRCDMSVFSKGAK